MQYTRERDTVEHGLSLVIITSVLGNMIASHNAVVRIQYGMGRAKALPSAFGLTGKRQTPYFAICVQIAVSVVVTLIMGLAWNETKAFGFLGFTNGLAGAVVSIGLVLLAWATIPLARPFILGAGGFGLLIGLLLWWRHSRE